MKIWVDADRTPRDAREIVRRAGTRLEIPVRFVTGRDLEPPGERTQVRAFMVSQPGPDDLVVTPDDVIGAELCRLGVLAIDVRGDEYVEPTIQVPAARELLSNVRSLAGGDRGPPPYDGRAKRAFAATLDRVLSRLC